MEEIIKKCLPTYDVLNKIGEGVYGSVFHVKDNLKERAVKVVPIMVERSLSYRTKKELDSKISHDFYAVQEYYGKIKGSGVIEIHDFHLVDKRISKQEAKAYLIILMEYCPENLSDFVLDNYPLSPPQAKQLMRELAEILNRLSDRTKDAFIVKDLKPSNLLINKSGQLLIGDLGGLQRLSSVSTAGNAQFTPNWSAPELIINSEAANISSLIYAYGFVCYFILQGSLPYEKKDFTERTRLIKEKGLLFKRGDIPRDMRRIIEKCLKFDPAHRPDNFREILKTLKGAEHQHKNRQLIIDDPSLSTDKSNDKSRSDSRPGKSFKNKSGSQRKSREPIENKPDNFINVEIDQLQPARKTPSEMHQIGDTWVEPVTGMKFVWVSSGSFQMGSGAWDGEGKKDEFPTHNVYIDGFWMGKFLITQSNWKKVMSSTFWKKVRPHNPSWFKMGPDYPVEQISWNETQEFIQKLISLNKNKYHFRLPTEAEWEYAARSCGKFEKYSGGKNLKALAWYSANSGMTSKPVGEKLKNKLGLYDMSGNVYEWCHDIYSETAYKSHKYKNPVITDGGTKRVIRGGSWSNSPHELRCTYRAGVNQDFKGNYIGFRIVMTQPSRKISVTS